MKYSLGRDNDPKVPLEDPTEDLSQVFCTQKFIYYLLIVLAEARTADFRQFQVSYSRNKLPNGNRLSFCFSARVNIKPKAMALNAQSGPEGARHPPPRYCAHNCARQDLIWPDFT